MIEFRNIDKIYADGTLALNNFSLKVNKGEFITLIGPSGCGKTTTMKMINRLIEPTSGTIYVDGKDIRDYKIHELRWNIGYVLQDIALFPHMTIEENIAIVPEMKKWKRAKTKNRTDDLLEMVGLDPLTYKKRLPHELSGGQQQRIGVIRALAADPDIVLMDEPFSALDPISREQLQKDIQILQREIQKTIVFVTHDMDEALALGDRVCLMKNGTVVQTDKPQELILNPKTDFAKEFIGNKKSLWQTAIDVIGDRYNNNILTEEAYNKEHYNNTEIWLLIDKNDRYLGAVHQGKRIELKTLPNEMQLFKATEIIQSSEQYLYPILAGEKLVGTLSYKEVVEFLKSNVRQENGVLYS